MVQTNFMASLCALLYTMLCIVVDHKHQNTTHINTINQRVRPYHDVHHAHSPSQFNCTMSLVYRVLRASYRATTAALLCFDGLNSRIFLTFCETKIRGRAYICVISGIIVVRRYKFYASIKDYQVDHQPRECVVG